jgi:pyridoxal phosphate enzyme (YggS family)
MAAACERAGRDADEVSLIAVSKTVTALEIAAAIEAGIHDFGENRTKLFTRRQELFSTERWHFIGSIQTNKIKDFVGRAALVHSVASERVLMGIARRAQALGLVQRLLIEVNVSGEQSKDGLRPELLPFLLEKAIGLAGIEVAGLMTMAPQGEPSAARAAFSALRRLRDDCVASLGEGEGLRLRELSMGMSEDYPIAIEEGATIVRIGRSMWV